MLIATICIGDSLVTLTRVIAVDKDDTGALPVRYVLAHTDMPTGKRVALEYRVESSAVRAFAAWIVSDEPDLNYAVEALRKRGAGPWLA